MLVTDNKILRIVLWSVLACLLLAAMDGMKVMLPVMAAIGDDWFYGPSVAVQIVGILEGLKFVRGARADRGFEGAFAFAERRRYRCRCISRELGVIVITTVVVAAGFSIYWVGTRVFSHAPWECWPAVVVRLGDGTSLDPNLFYMVMEQVLLVGTPAGILAFVLTLWFCDAGKAVAFSQVAKVVVLVFVIELMMSLGGVLSFPMSDLKINAASDMSEFAESVVWWTAVRSVAATWMVMRGKTGDGGECENGDV
jgi:hypothetical protein